MRTKKEWYNSGKIKNNVFSHYKWSHFKTFCIGTYNICSCHPPVEWTFTTKKEVNKYILPETHLACLSDKPTDFELINQPINGLTNVDQLTNLPISMDEW